jgi:mercuric ion transport protein
MTSQVDDQTRLAGSEANSRKLDLGQKIFAGVGLLGALAASSCCLVPLALFGIGVGGAWIGHLTRLAPYQPYFLGVAFICLGLGLWVRHGATRMTCAPDGTCTRPLPGRIVMAGFVVAGVLIVAVLAIDLLLPLFF